MAKISWILLLLLLLFVGIITLRFAEAENEAQEGLLSLKQKLANKLTSE